MLSKFQQSARTCCDRKDCGHIQCERKREFIRAIAQDDTVRLSTLKCVDGISTSFVDLSTFNTSYDVSAVNLTTLLSDATTPYTSHGYNNRMSSRMRLKGLRLTGQFYPFNGNAEPDFQNVSPCIARVSVVYDRAPAASPTIFSTAFSSTDEAGEEYVSIYADANPTKTDRICVVHDEFFSLPSLEYIDVINDHSVWLTFGDTMQLCYDRYIDLEGLITRYNDSPPSTPALPLSCAEGLLFVIVSCDCEQYGTWVSQWNARCYFYD